VSPSPAFEQIRTTDKNGWTPIQRVSPSQVWAEQNHWQERLNTHPGCEPLSSLWADQNHWWERLNIQLGCESLSSLWEDQNHWRERLNTHPLWQVVSPSPVFDQIRTTDKNGWTPIQQVSHSPVFEQIRTSTDKNGWTPIHWQDVSCSPVFEQISSDCQGLVNPRGLWVGYTRVGVWVEFSDPPPTPTLSMGYGLPICLPMSYFNL
jgi:hypothetical protein